MAARSLKVSVGPLAASLPVANNPIWTCRAFTEDEPRLDIETVHGVNAETGSHELLIETLGAGVRLRFGIDDQGRPALSVFGRTGIAEATVSERQDRVEMKLINGNSLVAVIEDHSEGTVRVELYQHG